ncbi:MAG TPA: DNA-binding response regulator, partial [Ruminococcaceae bacterium]|nr:DNA-binding response regulator [Oscillospiraceae bacterium]
CCTNGYELMELVEKELPDLVILDINMPFITGLEAARQIRHSYPHIKIVFLTGYTEFDYAKQAVELNALKYIVKPVSAQELRAVLDEARTALDRENRRIQKMADLEQLYWKSRKVLVHDLLGDLAQSGTIYERARAHGLQWDRNTFFQVAVLSADRTGG